MKSFLLGRICDLRSNVLSDILGGIMTTIVALPVAMAFGVASGLGAAAGLYGAMSCGLLAGVYVYSFHGPIIFAEVNTLNDAHENFSKAEQIIFDFEKAAFIDQSCAYYLNDLIAQLKEAGKTVQIMRISDSVRSEFESMHCDAVLQSEIVEEDHTFDRVSALMLQLNSRSI